MHKKHTSSNTFKKQYECNLPEHDSQLREKGCESAAPVLTGGKGSRQGQERGGKAGGHRTGSRGRSVGARLGFTEQGPGKSHLNGASSFGRNRAVGVHFYRLVFIFWSGGCFLSRHQGCCALTSRGIRGKSAS